MDKKKVLFAAITAGSVGIFAVIIIAVGAAAAEKEREIGILESRLQQLNSANNDNTTQTYLCEEQQNGSKINELKGKLEERKAELQTLIKSNNDSDNEIPEKCNSSSTTELYTESNLSELVIEYDNATYELNKCLVDLRNEIEYGNNSIMFGNEVFTNLSLCLKDLEDELQANFSVNIEQYLCISNLSTCSEVLNVTNGISCDNLTCQGNQSSLENATNLILCNKLLCGGNGSVTNDVNVCHNFLAMSDEQTKHSMQLEDCTGQLLLMDDWHNETRRQMFDNTSDLEDQLLVLRNTSENITNELNSCQADLEDLTALLPISEEDCYERGAAEGAYSSCGKGYVGVGACASGSSTSCGHGNATVINCCRLLSGTDKNCLKLKVSGITAQLQRSKKGTYTILPQSKCCGTSHRCYKHAQKSFYLYYRYHEGYGYYWGIGSDICGDSIGVSGGPLHDATVPDDPTQIVSATPWQVRYTDINTNELKNWEDASDLKMVCTEDQDGTTGCYYSNGFEGEHKQCGSSDLITEICGSGNSSASCPGNGLIYPHSSKCCYVGDDRHVGTACEWHWSEPGNFTFCPRQQVMTGFCSSGGSNQCDNAHASHGIYCCQID